MIDAEFLTYLKTNHPYLFDVELRIREVQKRTGFGDVSASFTLRYGKVEINEIGEFTKYLHSKDSEKS